MQFSTKKAIGEAEEQCFQSCSDRPCVPATPVLVVVNPKGVDVSPLAEGEGVMTNISNFGDSLHFYKKEIS